jgi:hypothetical protein
MTGKRFFDFVNICDIYNEMIYKKIYQDGINQHDIVRDDLSIFLASVNIRFNIYHAGFSFDHTYREAVPWIYMNGNKVSSFPQMLYKSDWTDYKLATELMTKHLIREI